MVAAATPNVTLPAGNRSTVTGFAKISDFTNGVVALKEETRCLPDKENVACYRELQAVQDGLSGALRESGVFAAQRRMAR